MAAKRMFVMLEVESEATAKKLAYGFQRMTLVCTGPLAFDPITVHQVQVNVAKRERTSGKARRGRVGR